MARTCSDCGVRDSALCGSLTDAELAELGKLGVQRRLARGETLVRAGDAPLACANIQSGVMKIASVTPGGSESIVGLVYAGDFVGRPFAGPSAHDVVALTDVELCVFPRAAFEQALTDHHRMERLLLERTLVELDRARSWLVRVGRATAGARVAGFLDDMARRLAAGNDCRRAVAEEAAAADFELPLSRSEIADLLGLTIETVSRQMTRLRAAGIIDLPGGRRIVVRDRRALAAAADAFD
jgi:CRP/FNR family transcriptional regulator, anaerobic regulatory protein